MGTIAAVSDLSTPSHRLALTRPLILSVYLLTGFCGVLLEQGFEKYTSLLVGVTASGSAAVLFAYFFGFAFGGWAVAALLKRGALRHPFRIYGLVELLIGVYGVLFTYGFEAVSSLLGPLQNPALGPLTRLAVRFAFSSLLILPASTLMGASFPLIAESLDPTNDLCGRDWVKAYASNLAGGVLAALAGAYLLLPSIGVRGAFWVCFAIAASVCAAALVFQAPGSVARMSPLPHSRARPPRATLLLVAAFLSGFLFLALEVVWTHLIATTLGCSVYAFSAMLAAVLTGLLLGALRVRGGAGAKPILFSSVLQLSALCMVVQFRAWDVAQLAYLLPVPVWLKSFYSYELLKFLVAAILIVPPAALLGNLFPLLLRSPFLTNVEHSYFVGYLNTANALGCLSGAIAGLFLFIPVWGSEASLKAFAAILFTLSIPFVLCQRENRGPALRRTLRAAVVICCLFFLHWNRTLLTSGLNVYAGSKDLTSIFTHSSKPGSPSDQTNMVFFEEEPQGGITTVMSLHQEGAWKHVLLTNGKFEGTDVFEGQGLAQIGVSAVPSQFVPAFDRALLIGLGTGQSAYTLSQLGYRRTDVAEFSPGIVHAADEWFADVNRHVLHQPALHLYVEDGRNVLLASSGRPYDLITIEIASVWFSSATNVYSQEFYRLAKSRLEIGGVLQQWIQFHHISPAEIACAVATLRSVFRYVSIWFVGGQGMLLATDDPQRIEPARRSYVELRLRGMQGIPDSARSAVARDIFGARLLNTEEVDRMLAASRTALNSDHNRWLEYATPRYNWSNFDWTAHNLQWLRRFDH
jgi:spermidine synthase